MWGRVFESFYLGGAPSLSRFVRQGGDVNFDETIRGSTPIRSRLRAVHCDSISIVPSTPET